MKKIRDIFKIEAEQNRVYGLDILRAYAMTTVLFIHGDTILPTNIRNFLYHFFPDGLNMFFVLSGYLIGGILIQVLEKEPPTFKRLLNFWSRRWLRTLPAYFAVLTLLIILSYFFTAGFSPFAVKNYFYFVQNFNSPHPDFFPEAWSLSVEEWFYLLIPSSIISFMLLLRLKPKQAVMFIAVLVIIFSVVYRYHRYRYVTNQSMDELDLIFRKQVVTRLDSLMFGVIGAHLAFYNKPFWIRYKKSLLLAGLVLTVAIKIATDFLLPNSAFFFCNVLFPAAAFATLMILPFLSQFKKGEGTLFKIITYISITSYSIYLIHGSLVLGWIINRIRPFGEMFTTQIMVKYLLYWILTLALSILLYKYLEKPFMDLRKHLK